LLRDGPGSSPSVKVSDVTAIRPAQPDQTFYLQLNSPVNCTLGASEVTAMIVNSDLLYLPTDTGAGILYVQHE
jgi:hypothetical protein